MTFANTNLYGLPGVWKLTSNSFCFSIQIAVSKTAIKKNARKETLSILQPWTFQFGKPNCSGVLCAGTKEQSLLPWECHMLSPAIWLGCLPTVHFCPGSEAAPSHSHYLFFWVLFSISSSRPKTWKLHLTPPERWWEEKHWLMKLFWRMGRFKVLCFWLKIQRGEPPNLSMLLS